MPENNWLRGMYNRQTQPGISLRDVGTRLLQRAWKPGDRWYRNLGRAVRTGLEVAAIIGTNGAAAPPILGNAVRGAAAAEVGEAVTGRVRDWWRGQGGGPDEAPTGSPTPSGRTWPTNMGPPASLAGVPGYRPAPGMGIMPSPQGRGFPSNPWVTPEGQPAVPAFPWEQPAEPLPYGEGQGMMRQGGPAPGAQRPSLDAFMVMREAPGAAAMRAGQLAIMRPRNIEK
jgi:hypothetical protein